MYNNMFCYNFQAGHEMLVDEDHQIQDLILFQHGATSNNCTGPVHYDRPPNPGRMSKNIKNKIGGDENVGSKKVVHREIERLRRQEMATLYASLRTLIPIQYVKGKRSMSDHINEAVKYIKHLRNEISEESEKRDELRKLSASSVNVNIDRSSSILVPACSVITVRPCSGGLEILCTFNFTDEGSTTLSTLLQVISRQGLVIVRCVSAKVEQRLFHTINTEVCDLSCIDLSRLQQKLLSEVFHNKDNYH